MRVIGILSGSTFISSCGSSERSKKLVSYIMPPEDGAVPGEAYYYPSTCTECPAGCGLTVKSREGWPVKLEGASGHPVNDGGLCVRGQSSLSRLYHPDRLKKPMLKSATGRFREATWEEAMATVAQALQESGESGKKSVYLSGRTTGTLSSLIDAFCQKTGVERLPQYELFSHQAIREASHALFGTRDMPRYRVEDADFLLTVGADILETFISPVSFAGGLARARARGGHRWFHVEPHLSLTGANADRRIVMEPMQEWYLLAYLLREVIDRRGGGEAIPAWFAGVLPPVSAVRAAGKTGISPEALREIAAGFAGARRPLLVAGGVSTAHQDGLHVALLASIIQWMTSVDGVPVDFSGGENYEDVASLREMRKLSERLGGKEIGVAFISRTDPAASLPPRYAFGEKLAGAKLSVVIGQFISETGRYADVVLPLSHPLETWDDAEPRKGIRSLVKPVVRPMHGTLSEGDILVRIAGKLAGSEFSSTYQEYLSREWKNLFGEAGRDEFLQKGFMETPRERHRVAVDWERAEDIFGKRPGEVTPRKPLLVLAPSIRTFDGRSRDLPLLSEIPDPLTTISYGRFVSVPEETARKMGVKDKDEVEVRSAGGKATLAVKVQPGLAEGVFVMFRDAHGDVGVDESTGGSVDYVEGVVITRTGRRVSLPILSGSFSQMGRGIIPDPVHGEKEHHGGGESLYPPHRHDTYRWAMAIDLDKCTGCAACVAACYVENNVPIVGNREQLKGREMSWLRVEPFYDRNGEVDFIPMMCQHCHYAPCEPVCPVYAAYHNQEGLNVQVYNRCVGTRYCANNCPYKVRRFNWFQHRWEKPLTRMLNPDISVRSKGVMEKCTFCIQRLRMAKDRAKDESRRVRDGEVTTACAQSCPTKAIVFGNLLDEKSKVYELSHSDRAYRVFEELGTGSSIYYLKGKKRGHGV